MMSPIKHSWLTPSRELAIGRFMGSSKDSIKQTGFKQLEGEIDFPKEEAAILDFWKQNKIFQKTLQADSRDTGPRRGTYVFYEGPPTANGLPHNGHVLTRAVKDVFPRYKTMCGYDVPRKAGWDTHGLPVEVEVEKELRIHGKDEIVKYGVKPFISRCIESVFRYTETWEKLTDKIGFWVDTDAAYVTYHKEYVESVWWALSELHRKKLLYKGHRVCWWWPQGGTALSAAEVGLNYKTVEDPSVYVAFPLIDEPDTALVAWTTTPWTLPSNAYAAVSSQLEYAVVSTPEGRRLVLAQSLVANFSEKLGAELQIERVFLGRELVGKRYAPPFQVYAKEFQNRVGRTKTGTEHYWYWRVIDADFVSADKGSGIVHIAPAFGEDDFEAHRQQLAQFEAGHEIPLLCTVEPDGKFSASMGAWQGLWVKAADPLILKDLRERGLLLFSEKYRHEYPFCWRADDDPLIQLARPAWYIRTTEKIQQAIANNRQIQWLPEHIQEGRFGDFLANNVDWALSRERFWGTPLNIWVCDQHPEHEWAPCSVKEIETRNPKAFDHFKKAQQENPELNPHLIVHKPWIDEVTVPCAECHGTMFRVSEVIDAWFDSGSMPFAQWGYPHVLGSKEQFARAFPADFISEAIDQTRGWFYSLLMVSTLVFDETTQKQLGLNPVRSFPHPYKTCVVLGHVCDREGKKESKSKGNYTPPEIILEKVKLEFVVIEDAQVQEGDLWISREDYDGLDLHGEESEVWAYRPDLSQTPKNYRLKPKKGMRRRQVLVHPLDLSCLQLQTMSQAESILPNDVPRLEARYKLCIEDPKTPAPGADAFRWFFYASSPPWTNTRHSLSNVRALQKEFHIKLRNVVSFFCIYANIDGFLARVDETQAFSWEAIKSRQDYVPLAERSVLDRWLISELALTVKAVSNYLDGYFLYEAAQRLVHFVDALSNWYVRRSRARFWAPQNAPAEIQKDKASAYFSLYESLVTVAHWMAPFSPFMAESIYQNLVRRPFPKTKAESIHLRALPVPDEACVDEPLALDMAQVRALVSLGLQVRTSHKLKVRQPLQRADLIVPRKEQREQLKHYQELIREELNVEEVRFLSPGEEGGAVRYVLKPNFKALGPKLGKRVQLAKSILEKANAALLHVELVTTQKIQLNLEGESVDLNSEEIEVRVEANPGYAAAGGLAGVVILHTEMTESLRRAGIAREMLSKIQGIRKEQQLGFTQSIDIGISGSSYLIEIFKEASGLIQREALVQNWRMAEVANPSAIEFKFEEQSLWIEVSPLQP